MTLKTILPFSGQYLTSGNKPILFPRVFSILERVILPRHEDFEKIYQNFIDQYGEEEGEKKYFAWLNEHGYDDTKPMPKKEGFSWAGTIKEMPGVDNLIRGQALHPLRTVHPDEWPEVREYLEEELEKSAHSMVDVPLILDHCQVLNGKVLGAEYEDGSIEYVAQLNDPNVMELIRNGAIKKCSVEFEWKSLDQVNGVAPRGINFTGLSLLRMFQPGDPKTTVEVWEGIIKELKEAKALGPAKPSNKSLEGETNVTEAGKEKRPPTLEARVTFLETSKLLKEQWLSKEEIEAKINELTQNRQALENELQQIAEEEQPRRDEIWQQIDLINAELQAYEEALAALIAGTAAPPEGGDAEEGKLKEQDDLEPEKDEHGCVIGKERYDEDQGKCVPIETSESKKTSLGEAIIAPPETPRKQGDLISKEEVLAFIPHERVWRSWSYGPQMLVRQLKHRLEGE